MSGRATQFTNSSPMEIAMAEDPGGHLTPTYFANIVTMNMNVDELAIELRRFDKSHREVRSEGV